MIKSLEINKVLYDVLNSKTDCNNRIFPIVAENGTSYPFMVYSRDNITSNSCKDGLFEDSVSFTVNIVAATYFQSVEIAQRVRELLSKRKITSNDITLINTELASASERFEDDAYIQTLQFTTTIINQ